jgi:peptidase E
MSKIYFLGGEEISERTMIETDKLAIDDSGRNPVVLYFPWTAEIEKRKYRKLATDYFKDIGAGEVIFAELSDTLQKLKEKMDLSDMIYLPGGDPNLLSERLNDLGVSKLLKRYRGVIVGNSAGSLVLCRRYVAVRGQDDNQITKSHRGIAVVDFAVSVHYKSEDKGRSGEEPDRELRELSERVNIPIYAIPENGAIIYDGGNFKFVGGVYKFYKGRKTRCRN